ncbi:MULTISPECIES: hypothetical protein [Nostocaceae]|nr:MULTISPECIES: hypothetical protein [Nostocaceae]
MPTYINTKGDRTPNNTPSTVPNTAITPVNPTIPGKTREEAK